MAALNGQTEEMRESGKQENRNREKGTFEIERKSAA
jgi:hypothetical protein